MDGRADRLLLSDPATSGSSSCAPSQARSPRGTPTAAGCRRRICRAMFVGPNHLNHRLPLFSVLNFFAQDTERPSHGIVVEGPTPFGAHQAFVPPSTVRLAPVIYAASGLATKATSAATSS